MKIDNNELLNNLVQLAQKKGADECDIILNRSKSLSLSAFDAAIDKYQVSSSQLVGIRVIKDKKVGLSSSESLDQHSVETMVDQALDNSKFSSAAVHQTLENSLQREPVGSTEANFTSDTTAIDDKIKLALELESDVKELDSNAQVPYTAYADGESEKFYQNSTGVINYQKENFFQCYTSALLKDGDNSATYFDLSLANNFNKLEAKKCATNSYKVAKQLLHATPCTTGKYDIMFDINSLSDFFGAFQTIFSGQSAMEGKNKFKDQLGKLIAAKELTILDQPRFGQAFHKNYFDDEGFNMGDVALIKNGMLENFLHSSETANYFKLAHNARSSRGAKSSLNVQSTNTVILPGTTDNVLNGTVFKIIDLDGLHSGTDAISGDFSLGVRGMLMRDGKIEQNVKGVTISGNFFTLLNQIEAVGKQAFHNDYRSFFAPEIRFNSIDVAGA